MEATFTYTSGDLLFEYQDKYYGPSDPKVSGIPDHTAFDKCKKLEVLYMINAFAARRNFRDKRSFAKVEKLLHLYLPGELETQADVLNWIEDHWFDFI